MRRKAKIKQIVDQIDLRLSVYPRDGDQIVKDALYNYRETLVEEFYQTSKPQTKKEPLT